jgi:hypothetical protein
MTAWFLFGRNDLMTMTKMTRMTSGVLVVVIALFGAVTNVSAVTITSADFTIGYGFTGPSPGSWNTTETAAQNTATTIGDFSFVPSLLNQGWSGTGPTFPNRVLSNGPSGNWSAFYWGNPNADNRDEPPEIVGTYNGVLPGGATNVQTTLEITSIAIWVSSTTVAGGPFNVQWDETTAGHLGSSTPVVSGTGGSNAASSYTRLQWNPGDFSVPGLTSTRGFTIPTAAGNIATEGFEVFGNVSMSYDLIPEPTSVTMMVLGLFGLAACAGRRRA